MVTGRAETTEVPMVTGREGTQLSPWRNVDGHMTVRHIYCAISTYLVPRRKKVSCRATPNPVL